MGVRAPIAGAVLSVAALLTGVAPGSAEAEAHAPDDIRKALASARDVGWRVASAALSQLDAVDPAQASGIEAFVTDVRAHGWTAGLPAVPHSWPSHDVGAGSRATPISGPRSTRWRQPVRAFC